MSGDLPVGLAAGAWRFARGGNTAGAGGGAVGTGGATGGATGAGAAGVVG